MPVLLHANSDEAQAFGLEAGVDVLAHGLWNWSEPGSTVEVTRSVRKVLDGVVALDRDIGTVEAGKRANLLLLRQDPRKTIEAYMDIVSVILGGRVLDAVQLAANHSRPSLDGKRGGTGLDRP